MAKFLSLLHKETNIVLDVSVPSYMDFGVPFFHGYLCRHYTMLNGFCPSEHTSDHIQTLLWRHYGKPMTEFPMHIKEHGDIGAFVKQDDCLCIYPGGDARSITTDMPYSCEWCQAIIQQHQWTCLDDIFKLIQESGYLVYHGRLS